ncbi:MAG: bifunctional diaminohydroxyphosphoribosylaminopyrimidine deaminase/5-amino-6-(5-phosphoribosylamino)uracil reductase RibD [Leptospiraceae bacterium]|nr:bifunctional diaminohydroxyphosphoribosylaminopyrimidine deaminase/5-amino-6-(5-phosphoribosylamino)uracil reductase RibD [Leptospiraceae bacterium]MCP5493414.1 bifunctional diaminohydroxyphosphoribosylaminopyrimidine deaminase/5-amino-6-(5-phosphoribosylamino)uracil reductase RibD [Leptospiraceae bacterium]
MLNISSSKFQNVLDVLTRLSFLSMGYSSPNPPVACVITDLNGNVLSKGFTQKTGENHAEREAYRNFSNKEIPHVVFVTLEPCSHYGKTPPCLDLILQHKPKALVYGMRDPNPLVQKRDGLQECEAMGITIVQNSEIEKIANRFLSGFFSRIKQNRPSIWIKSALSEEGYFARKDKFWHPLSCNESNNLTQFLRAKLDAVLVGPGTIFHDEPKCNLRGVKTLKNAQEKNDSEELFFKSLFQYSKEPEVVKFHCDHLSSYQPFRVFVLNSNRLPPEKFLKRQKTINYFYGTRRTLFFILLSLENVYLSRELARLKELSYIPPEFVSQEDLYLTITKRLSEIGINTLLVEGGNLMYSTFSKELQTMDSIALICTKSQLEDGIKPKLDVSGLKMAFSGIASVDTWNIYQKGD